MFFLASCNLEIIITYGILLFLIHFIYQTLQYHILLLNNINTFNFFLGISEPRQFLVQSLVNSGSKQPGYIPGLIGTTNEQTQTILQTYFSKFNLQLI